jgi:hypothetical protein
LDKRILKRRRKKYGCKRILKRRRESRKRRNRR